MRLVNIFSVVAASATHLDVHWNDCSESGKSIDNVVVSPKAPELGKPFTIKIMRDGIDGPDMGRISYVIKDGPITAFEKDLPQCENSRYSMDAAAVACNRADACTKAVDSLTFSAELGTDIQHIARYADMIVRGYTKDSNLQWCAKLSATVVDPITPETLMIPPYYPLAVKDALVNKGASISFTWDPDCSDPDTDMATVNNVTFAGSTLGKEITIKGEGRFHKPAQDGTTYTVVVYAMGVPIFSHTDDFCTDTTVMLPMGMGQINMKGLSCPGEPGKLTLDESLLLSSHQVFPKAQVKLSAADKTGEQYFCINLYGTITQNEEISSNQVWI